MDKTRVIRDIATACEVYGLTMPEQLAYILATVEHETAGTFQPVEEAYWLTDEWRRQNLRYYPYHGRGYVQLTWRENYQREGERLGLDLVNNPDLAKEHKIAVDILVHGFKYGAFTGKKLEDYIYTARNGKPSFVDMVNARRVINGTDKAEHIANIARGYIKQATDLLPGAEATGPMVWYSTSERIPAAVALQELLRSLGLYHGKIDGVPGPKTSAGYKGLGGGYLHGDPRGRAAA